MKFSLLIAYKYLSYRKRSHFIQILGLISFFIITLGTAALITALSIFNGLEDMTKKLINVMKPDVKIIHNSSRFFSSKYPFIIELNKIDKISKIVKSIEINSLILYKNNNLIAKIKGVSSNFLYKNNLKNKIIGGRRFIRKNNKNYAIIGKGIYYSLKAKIYSPNNKIFIYYPIKVPSSIFDIKKIFRIKSIEISGVFSLEQEVDREYIITHISFLRKLLKKPHALTSLDIYIKDSGNIHKIMDRVKKIIPNNFTALDLDNQTEGLISAMKIEKRALAAVCFLIMIAALINMFFVFSMLVITKRKDIGTFMVLGATERDIKNIFLLQGMLLTGIGITLGTILALVFILIQKKIGIITLGVESSIIKYYPIKLKLQDIFLSNISIFIISIIAIYQPAYRASKIANFRELY